MKGKSAVAPAKIQPHTFIRFSGNSVIGQDQPNLQGNGSDLNAKDFSAANGAGNRVPASYNNPWRKSWLTESGAPPIDAEIQTIRAGVCPCGIRHVSVGACGTKIPVFPKATLKLSRHCVLSCAGGQLCFCTVRHGRTLSVSVPALQRLAAAPATVAPRSLCTRGRFLQRTTFRAVDPPALTQTDGFLVWRAPLGMTQGRKLVDGRLADVLAQRHALTAGARYVHSVWHAIIAMPSLRVVSN